MKKGSGHLETVNLALKVLLLIPLFILSLKTFLVEIILAGFAINADLELARNKCSAGATFQVNSWTALVLHLLPGLMIIVVLVLGVCTNLPFEHLKRL